MRVMRRDDGTVYPYTNTATPHWECILLSIRPFWEFLCLFYCTPSLIIYFIIQVYYGNIGILLNWLCNHSTLTGDNIIRALLTI